MISTTVDSIIEYLATRGFSASEDDKEEILARVSGHESAAQHRTFEENAKVFIAYRGDLRDFDSRGDFSGEKTRATDSLLSGPQDRIFQYAFLEANASGGFVVVYDGNGKLCKIFDEHKPPLVAFRTQGRLKNADAEFRDEVAEDSDYIQILFYCWREAGRNVAQMKSQIARDRREPAGQNLVFITEEGSQKILWRERV